MLNKEIDMNVTSESYCSRQQGRVRKLFVLQEGIKGEEQVQRILEKKLLCRHDVEDINQVYQTIERIKLTQLLKKIAKKMLSKKLLKRLRGLPLKKISAL